MNGGRHRLAFVVSGLPAGGKSTVGKYLARALDLPLLDKDDYLERLFAERGTGDSAWRQALSRESDELMRQTAADLPAVILVSHWRPRGLDSKSGTPLDWFEQSFGRLVELNCDCPVELAAERFIARKRHPGHLDRLKSRREIIAWLEAYQTHLPLLPVSVERITPDSENDLDALAERLTAYLVGIADNSPS